MKPNRMLIASIIIIVVIFIVTLAFYPRLPEMIASHWNAQGEADGYMQKFSGAFLLPFILIGLFLLLVFIPNIDPLKKNIQAFRPYYDTFILIFIIFMGFVQLQILLWNVGTKMNPSIIINVGGALLFYYVGILLEKSKRNWFIGIRTPWTLSSDTVWDKTHKMGSKLFKIAAMICLIGVFFPKISAYIFLIPVLSVAVFTIVYSYFEYRKEVSNGGSR